MELLQTAEDIIFLTDKVREIVLNIVRKLPHELQLQVDQDLESFGYDFVIQHALTKDEVPYLVKCMQNELRTIIKRRTAAVHRYAKLHEDPEFDPGIALDDPCGDSVLDRMLAAFHHLNPEYKRRCLVFLEVVIKGSTKPIGDAAGYMGMERHAMTHALQSWKEFYAQTVRREVRQVRSIKHLWKLCTLEFKRECPSYKGVGCPTTS